MTKNEILDYVIGGNATFTIKSPSGRRFTYKMIKSIHSDTYLIKLLQGDDNTKDYHTIGRYYPTCKDGATIPSIYWTKQSYFITYKDEYDPTYHKAGIQALLLHTDFFLEKGCEFYKSNRCAKCGRLLTTPESILDGFGPHCKRKLKSSYDF